MSMGDSKDMSGKVCLVTGGTAGIGQSTALALAKLGAEVVIACRNLEKGERVAEAIRQESGNPDVSLHKLDLGSLQSVRASAEAYLASSKGIDVLVNNAGLAGQRGATDDGFEIAFGTNHLGHFLFTLLLLPRLRESSAARIVMVSSSNHRTAKDIDFSAVHNTTASVTGLPEYGVSKLANVLFAKELSRRLKDSNITTYSLNPGRIASDIWKRVPWPLRTIYKWTMKTSDEGARTSVLCASSASLADESGLYYNQEKREKASDAAQREDLALALWEQSCKFVGIADPLASAAP
jgi:retinol dehydrogenase-12